jgi:effector-binding domain-containing protein
VDYEIVKVEIPPHTLAAVRETVRLADLPTRIPDLLGEVWDFIKTNQITATGHNVIVYSEEMRGAEGDLAFDALFGVEVRGIFNPSSRVTDASTPGGPSAKTVHWGPYAELPRAHDAVRRWCAQNGQRMSGTNWEVYGDWSDDPAQLRTDVFYSLEHGSRQL